MKSNVLIVEDSPEVRSGLKIALEGQGYRVKAATDGREGIQIFREWKPDIALLDIRMPRLSGIDVCTLIRNESDVPVIMFSGVDETDDVRLAIQRGANDYVLKDTGFRELLDRVAKHLRHRAAEVLLGPGSTGRVLPFSDSELAVAQSVSRRKPAPDLKDLRVNKVKVDAKSLASVEPGDVLENLVIVAHSEQESLAQLANIAGRTGFEVANAATGKEAVDLLAYRQPKLLVIGNTLTDMNCLDIVKAVSNHNLGELMGIVLALGRRAPELARRGRYLGVHEIVIRPWDNGSLDVAIRSALTATRDARSRLKAA